MGPAPIYVPGAAGRNRPVTSCLSRIPGQPQVTWFPDRLLACRLTCAFAVCLEGEFPFCRFPHVMMWCRVAVLRPWRPARAGFAGFRRTGGLGGLRADVPEPAADAGRGEPARRSGSFPGAP